MIFDVFFLILIAAYAFKGFNKGGIYASFNFVGYFLAFIIAFKFSGNIVGYLVNDNNSTDDSLLLKLMPIIAYLLVFGVVIFLTRLLAKTIKSINKTLMLGWLDRVIGAAIFTTIAMVFGGTFVWLLAQLNFFSESTQSNSKLYSIIISIGGFVIDNIGSIIPFIKETSSDIIKLLDNVNT